MVYSAWGCKESDTTDCLDETGSSKYKLSQLIQYEIDNFHVPVSIKEVEFIIQEVSRKKSLSSDCFTGEFYQVFEELI